jgi:hypothetical protein
MYLSVFEAVENRHLLQFQYCGYFRVIEPHVYGHDPRYGDVLRGFQIGGADQFGNHRGWKWFRTGKIEGLQVLPVHFMGPREGAQLTVERLERTYCHLEGMVLPHGSVRPLPAASVVDC